MVFAAEEDQNEADQIPKSGKKAAVKKKNLLREREKRAREKQKSWIRLTVSGHPLSVRLLLP